MGGCKCSFRNCKVSTNNPPGISFFHYPHPVKRKEKFEKWVKYSNRPELTTLQITQIINRAVCAKHFRDECFMNYKKNKLTQSAVPTLDVLPNGMVLDYEKDDNPKPTKLDPTPYEHLKPPNEKTSSGDEDFISIDPDGSVFLLNVVNSDITANDSNNSSYNIYIQNDSNEVVLDGILDKCEPKPSELKKLKISKLIPPDPDIKLHKTRNKTIRKNKIIEICEVDSNLNYTINSSKSNLNKIEDKSYENVRVIEDNILELPQNAIQDIYTAHNLITEINNTEKETHITEKELDQILLTKQTEFDAKLQSLKETSIPKSEMQLLENTSKEELDKKNDELKKMSVKYELMKKELENLKKQSENEIEEYKNEIIKLKKEKTKLQENDLRKVKTEVDQKKPASASTKAQLFNGVKKYLSSSMSALVRMEMFGAPERQWKSDEKQCSVELMKLGKNVYTYFCDEWRCRLPPSKDVENWMNELTISDEEENL